MTIGDPDTSSTEKVLIAVMGLTGSGKSTFINLASQSPNKLKVGHSIQSCTAEVEASDPFMVDGREVVLYDTPGFDDTNLSESQVLNFIAIALEKQYRKGQTLHGIIYIHRISDVRVGGVAKTNFRIFRRLCGDNCLKNVVIMTSMWSKVGELEGKRRVAELASLDDFFLSAIQQGAVMIHHNPDAVETAHETIRDILKNHPEAVSIQTEIVDEKKDIDKTGAGMAVDEKLAELVQKYELKLKEQLAAAEEARRERDEVTRREQMEEAAKVRATLERMDKEKRDQAEQYRKLQQQLIETETARRRDIEESVERARRNAADVEARMARLAINNPTPQPARQAAPKPSHKYVTSGKKYTLENKKYSLCAKVDTEPKYVTLQRMTDSSREVWRFHSSDATRWTIESDRNPGYYMSATGAGTLRVKKSHRSDATTWRVRGIKDTEDECRIYLYDHNGNADDWSLISVDDGGTTGTRVTLCDRYGGNDEIWVLYEE